MYILIKHLKNIIPKVKHRVEELCSGVLSSARQMKLIRVCGKSGLS